ncbi:unnamed protein product [Prorocentrum cordatum]|uniref:Uncharacterized protein n=1 Tax=Prorocentrum cordatum TaxID=2364126 RepID=A0ABN9PDB4_9DINO|nr:unnamed protein product [Polarella glacialis]
MSLELVGLHAMSKAIQYRVLIKCEAIDLELHDLEQRTTGTHDHEKAYESAASELAREHNRTEELEAQVGERDKKVEALRAAVARAQAAAQSDGTELARERSRAAQLEAELKQQKTKAEAELNQQRRSVSMLGAEISREQHSLAEQKAEADRERARAERELGQQKARAEAERSQRARAEADLDQQKRSAALLGAELSRERRALAEQKELRAADIKVALDGARAPRPPTGSSSPSWPGTPRPRRRPPGATARRSKLFRPRPRRRPPSCPGA